jgi:hypothetical protein
LGIIIAGLATAAISWAGGGSAAAASDSDPSVVASEPRATPVSAYGGWLVWSSYRPAAGGFVLMAMQDGLIRQLPVRSRHVPFDASVGRDATGRPVVVYSRCRREPRRYETTTGSLPDYNRARGCDLYRFNLTGGRGEERLHVGSRTTSEYLPSIWGHRLLFARIDPRARTAPAAPRLKWLNLRTRRMHTLPAGTLGQYDEDSSGKWLLGLNLRGTRLAFSWAYWPRRCFGIDMNEERVSNTSFELWVGTLNGRHTRLEHTCDGGAALSPHFEAGALEYLRRAPLFDRPGAEFRYEAVRYSWTRHSYEAATITARENDYPLVTANDETGSYELRWRFSPADGQTTITLVRAGERTYSPTQPRRQRQISP